MGRRIAYLHIGLPGSGGGFLEAALVEHSLALEERGVRHPTRTADEAFRAAIEIRRDHRAWGYRRSDVEGTWAEICRRIRKHQKIAVVSQELLSGCTPSQMALLLDTLAGIEVHVVVTARRADAEPRAWIWRSLGELVGFDAERLPLTDSGLPPYLIQSLAQAVGREPYAEAPAATEDQLWWTTALLSAALVEVAQLREHERALVERNAKLEKKRSKLKRRLAEID